MTTNTNTATLQDEMFEMSDEMLEPIAGGEIVNWKTKITLNRYIKECKLRGLSLSDALTEVQNIYGRNERYCNAFVGYVTENW